MKLLSILWKLTKRFWRDLYKEVRREYFVLDINSLGRYPANALSNFAEHHFVIDGVECYSMEGFIQSLKTENPYYQQKMCRFIGMQAKERGVRAGKVRDWRERGMLLWQGQEIDRFGAEYQELLNKAYDALFENREFRDALRASGKRTFIHSVGKNDPHQTVLTEKELCDQLYRLRNKL